MSKGCNFVSERNYKNIPRKSIRISALRSIKNERESYFPFPKSFSRVISQFCIIAKYKYRAKSWKKARTKKKIKNKRSKRAERSPEIRERVSG